MKKRVHITWHFTALCAGVVSGVVAARWWNGFSDDWWWLVVGGLIVTAGMKRWRILLICSLLAGVMVGNWRGSDVQTELARYQQVIGKNVELRGVVSGDAEISTGGRTVVKLREERHGGIIWVTLRGQASSHVQRGDRLRVQGTLQEGFGTFVATLPGAKITAVERTEHGDPALALRNAFSSDVQQAITEPASQLGIGYLLGQKQALPADLQEAMVITGLTHVVVASGYNLTILVRFARRIFAKWSKYLAALTSVGMVGVFVAVTGMSPSMSRAGLVALLAIWAWYYGRKFHPATLLLFAASVTLLVNPSYGWGDIGWLLSFAAFAGVMIVAPLLQAYFYEGTKPPFMVQIVLETIAAQLVTAPIIIAVFGQFSNIALLANALIVPFIPLAMLLTFIAGVGAWLLPGIAQTIAWPAQVVLDAMVGVVRWAAEVPGAQVDISLAWWEVGLWYAAIIAACVYLKWRTGYRLRDASVVE